MDKEKKARVDSPEELNRYIRVSTPAVWIALAVMVALLMGAVAWAVFGTVDVIDAAGNVTSVHPITFVTN